MVGCSKKTKAICIEDKECKWIVGYGCVNINKDESTLPISLRNKSQSKNKTSQVAKMSSPPAARMSSPPAARMRSSPVARMSSLPVARMSSPPAARMRSPPAENNQATDGSVSPVLSSHSMGKLSERFILFDKIVNVVKHIKKACINFNTEKPNVQDIIVFDKLIGTPSTFGINYLTKINGRKICCKIQASGNMATVENFFLKNLTIIAERDNYQHFPLLYHTISCSTQPQITDTLP